MSTPRARIRIALVSAGILAAGGRFTASSVTAALGSPRLNLHMKGVFGQQWRLPDQRPWMGGDRRLHGHDGRIWVANRFGRQPAVARRRRLAGLEPVDTPQRCQENTRLEAAPANRNRSCLAAWR